MADRPLDGHDVNRIFLKLQNGALDEAQRERRDIQTLFIKGGGLQASRYPVTVEDMTQRILKKSVGDAMFLLAEVRSRTDMPLEQYRGTAVSHVTNIAYRLVNLVEETIVQAQGTSTINTFHLRAKYENIVTDALADLEVGVVNSKFITSGNQTVTVNVHGDNPGNIQIAGHGAQQTISQAKVAQQVDLAILAGELERVRAELAKDITDVNRAVAVGHVAQAEQAAKEGNEDGTRQALASVGKGAGKWIVDAAGKVGTTILTEWVKHQIGM